MQRRNFMAHDALKSLRHSEGWSVAGERSVAQVKLSSKSVAENLMVTISMK